jgi:hypothetical protein
MHPMQIILQVTHHGARPPPLPHCPPALARLMERCWQKDPAQRWERLAAIVPRNMPAAAVVLTVPFTETAYLRLQP